MTKLSVIPKLAHMEYRVVEPLGTGAGSTVLLISDKTRGGAKFALKVVNRQDADDDVYISQALTEYEVTQRLHHPNIIKIYDCRRKKRWFRLSRVELLMEYIEGKPLDEVEMPEMGQLVLIFNKVASALVHMHRRGIYHGDMKPSNIMLSKTGGVKLIDFGTAWIKGEEKGRIQGTPQYMAPEQPTEKIVDAKTDIYNFGATMYRMFTGRYANMGGPPTEGSKYKPAPPIQINPNIAGTLNETILACLQINRGKRPAGMFEVQHQLAAVAKYLGLEGEEPRGSHDEDE
jgi:serine/threonine protein kinase